MWTGDELGARLKGGNYDRKRSNQIYKLSNTVVSKRNELLTLVCEILGNEWYMTPWCDGCSYALANDKENLFVSVETYRFANPTSYALKTFVDGRNTYFFDKYGNLVSTY